MRIKREFSNKFKRAAVRRMATVPVAEVAQACGVSVSVLHRWRKQFGSYRADGDSHAGHIDAGDGDEKRIDAGHIDAKPGGRRVFSKEFKESVVKRLEAGESVGGLVRALELNPTVVRRWRNEWRKFGEAAFSGYGKTRSPSASTRTVIVRFTEEEYNDIKAASLACHASSLPDFVRGQILPAREAPSVAEIADRLDALIGSVEQAVSIASVRQAAQRTGQGR